MYTKPLYQKILFPGSRASYFARAGPAGPAHPKKDSDMNDTALPAPAPRAPSPLNSSYTATQRPDGWMEFRVVGAAGPSAPWWLLAVGPLVGGSLGFQIGLPQTMGGVLAGFFLALCYAVGRAGSLGTFRSRRAPAGTVVANRSGIRLPNGRFIPADRLRRLVCRNVQDGVILTSVGVGGGMVGGMVAMGAARHAADANIFLPISFQIDAESDGQSYPVVGGLTAATARAVFDDLCRVLDLS